MATKRVPVKRIRTSQPQGAVRLNPQFPPPDFALTGDGLTPVYGAVTQEFYGASQKPVAIAKSGGLGFGYYGTASMALSGFNVYPDGQEYSYSVNFSVDAIGSIAFIVNHDNAARTFQFRVEANGRVTVILFNTAVATFTATDTLSLVPGAVNTAVFTVGGGFVRLFVNGRHAESTAYSGVIKGDAYTFGIDIGNRQSAYALKGNVYGINRFKTALNYQTALRLSENHWQIFAPANDAIYIPAAGGGGIKDLAANAAAQAVASAELLKGVTLAGAAVGVSLAGAGLSLSVPLSATVSAQASSTGQIDLRVSLQGNALASALATAGLGVGKPLAASASAQAGGSADLSVAAPSGVVDLAAGAQAQSAAGATLSLAINLSAAAISQASSSAAFSGAAVLAAQAIADAQASAALAVGKSLAGVGAAQASSGATLWLQVPLSASALAAASGSAALGLTVTLSAAAISSGGASASLPVVVMLAADGVAVATSGASLQVTGQLTDAANYVARGYRRTWSRPPVSRAWTARL